MTDLQQKYQQLQETKRANLESERLKQASIDLEYAKLSEEQRTNIANENIKRESISSTQDIATADRYSREQIADLNRELESRKIDVTEKDVNAKIQQIYATIEKYQAEIRNINANTNLSISEKRLKEAQVFRTYTSGVKDIVSSITDIVDAVGAFV